MDKPRLDSDRLSSNGHPAPAAPPSTPAPAPPSKLPLVLAAAGGALFVGAIVLVLAAVVTLWFLFQRSAPSGASASSPLAAAAPAAGATEADFLAWKDQMDRLARPGAAAPAAALPAGTVGWWDRTFTLPAESAVREALAARLPAGLTLTSIQPASFTKRPDGIQATYRITFTSSSALVLVPTAPFPVPAGSSALTRKWMPLAIHAADLPTGTAYTVAAARSVLEPGQTIETAWNVRRAAKVDGRWRVLEADPIVYQRHPAFERRIGLATPGAFLLRSTAELDAARALSAQSVAEIQAAATDVAARVAAFRSEAMASVPSAVADTGGRGGSGTPTKTGVGALGGAAVGGSIGAAAGGGEGAAIGAGAGALLGGIIGYNVGRGDEKRAASSRNSARQQAINAANSRVKAFEAQLLQETEAALRAKADAHNARLAALN